MRQLQQALSEKEEALKSALIEKSSLLSERENFTARLRTLDESENRYKDENWNLETQIHEHISREKEAADREKKLTQALNVLQAEKANSQKELDEIKLNHSKLAEQHTSAMKTHDVELGALKRTVANVENEKETLQFKVKEITSQNTELAKAITRHRALSDEHKSNSPIEEDVSGSDDNGTPDNSPPPSPIKNTPRHSHLEAETMKSSLQHAHRMIQSLKGNIHREKTEKLELKRMLQDARDELEVRRADAPAVAKKNRKASEKDFKKPYKPNQLGGMRNSRSEVSIEEMAWEDQDMESSPTRATTSRINSMPGGYESTDQFDTSNEASTAYVTANNSDDFETASERDTETDAFVTTNEGNTDSEDLTETEGANMGTIRASKHQRPSSLMQAGNRNSYNSTASLSGDEYSYGQVTTPKQPSRLNLLQTRGSHSSSRTISTLNDDFYASPPQPSTNATPQRHPGGQTLFDQLGELSEGESYTEAGSSFNTPVDGRSRNVSIIGTPTPANIPLPPTYLPVTPKEEVLRPKMVDSGVMTDAWEPAPSSKSESVVPAFGGLLGGAGVVEAAHQLRDRTDSQAGTERPMSDASSQWTIEQDDRLSPLGAGQYNNRMSMMSMQSTTSTQPGDIAERLEHFPTPPTTTIKEEEPLSLSTIQTTVDEEPMVPEVKPRMSDAMSFSSIATTAVEPVMPEERPAPQLALVPIQAVGTEAIDPVIRPQTPVKMAFAPLLATAVEPRSPTPPQLGFVTVTGIAIEPVAPVEMPAPTLAMSNIAKTAVEPIEPVQKSPEPINSGFSAIGSTHTEPTVDAIEERVKHEMPGALPETPFTPIDEPSFAMSSIQSTDVEPITPRARPVTPINYGISNIQSTDVEPLTPKARPVTPIKLAFSGIGSTIVDPVQPVECPQTPVNLGFSTIKTAVATSPKTPNARPVTPPRLVTPVVLSFTVIQQIETTPIVPPSPRPSSKRDGFFIPAADEPTRSETPQPETPKGIFGGITKFVKEKAPVGMFIAEDETRTRSPQDSAAETPESQGPFKEITANTDARPVRKEKKEKVKVKVAMEDSMAQTMLTSEQIEAMFRSKAERRASNAAEEREALNSANISPTIRPAVLPPSIRVRRSQDSGRERPLSRSRTMGDALSDTENDITVGSYFNRPSSARRSSLNSHPPLPPNHQQVIKEAEKRTGSAASNKPGLMGPPPLPASAFRAQSSNSNKAFGPITPRGNSAGTQSPQRNGTTPRAHRSENNGTADVFGPAPPVSFQSGLSQVRSRASSITSFASEVESRFGLRNGHEDLPGLGTGTDPRMIQAITQTMIGEYLWKYTRKAGSSAMSSTRHRRYFWVHPYTRTLYWSDRDPATAGKMELKAKSVQIEAVRVVQDDNPLPPGLHRKSLVIVSPGRTVKVTAITGQRHECWFNALSYLLLRGDGTIAGNDSDEVVGGLTTEDTREFNPSIHSRSRSRKGPASLSSYNSRGTGRGESPGKHSNHQSSAAGIVRPKMSYDTTASRQSMVSRLSNYWHPRERRDGSMASTSRRQASSRLSRRSEDGRHQGSIYEASEVADSAEDLRREMERQERESDRLENVRACCDGKLPASRRLSWDGKALCFVVVKRVTSQREWY